MRAAFGIAGIAAAAMIVAPCPARAQTSGQVLERAAPEAPSAERAPLGAAPQARAPILLAPEAGVAILRSVEIEGATRIDAASLSPIWTPLIGQSAGTAELSAIGRQVQERYRVEGFLFTRAVVAPLDPGTGTLRIIVVEARIDAVFIEEPAGLIGPVRALLERFAAPLVGLENPRLADVERVLLLMNDVPGIRRATAVPGPGSSGPGSVALSINVERDAVTGAVFADTRQQPSFGEGLVGGLVEFGGYTAAADTTRLTASASFWDSFEDFEERTILQAEHARHIGASGARIGGRVLVGRTRPGDDLAPLDLEGEEFELEAWVEAPLIRTRPFSLSLRGGFEALDDTLDVNGGIAQVSDDRLRILYLSADALARDPYGFTSFDVTLRQGLGWFGGSERGDPALSRIDGDPRATVLRASIEREQPLGDDFAVFVAVDGQYASDPLLAGEEYAAGGTTFGRGYDPSEQVGDHGVGGALELRWRTRVDTFETLPFDAEFYGFGDAAKVWSRGDEPDADLASVGAGVRAVFEGDLLLGAEAAKPFDPLRRTEDDDVRFFFTLQKRF